ncbi:MAG TPA: cytochrome c [Gemmatimonadaceae bacterium]|nr:cytochrome c [Gemmatimonadaceae bacterium]
MNRLALVALTTILYSSTNLYAQPAHPQKTGNGTPSKTHDDLQPPTLPPLPAGMTIQMIVAGDSIYHGQGNCAACHGIEAQGLPAAGDALTVGLNYAQPKWESIDSVIYLGIPERLTRSPIQMPPRGGRSDLTPEQVRRVAAYIWAISQTRGEPWPGGHQTHFAMTPLGIEAPSTETRTRASQDSLPKRK